MMYLIDKIAIHDHTLSKVVEAPPFGPGFSEEDAHHADTMEIWGTRFSDPDPDYVEYRLIHDGHTVKTRRFAGY